MRIADHAAARRQPRRHRPELTGSRAVRLLPVSRVLRPRCGATASREVTSCRDIGTEFSADRVGEAVSGDVLYAIEHTMTETAIVVGHTGCGAVTATYDDLTDGLDEPAGIEHCLGVLKPHLEPALEHLPEDIERAAAIDRLVEYNVDRQVEFLRDSDDVPDAVDVFGVVYDFQDVYGGQRGEVHVINVDGEPMSTRSGQPIPISTHGSTVSGSTNRAVKVVSER